MPFPTFSSPGQRPTLRDKNRMSPLPSYSNIVQEKHQLTGRPSRWTTTLVLPLPGRRLPIVLPIPPRISQFVFNRFGPRKATTILIFGFLFFVCTLFAFGKRFGSGSKQWPQPFSDPPSLVFGREDLRKVWEWEIASGHYPSNRRIPEQIGFTSLVSNPGLPPPRTIGSWNLPAAVARKGGFTVGTGAPRTYFHRENQTARQVAYPPRPVSGSVADLDVVMDYCDFSTQKYVRDCLEVMRVGAGLDNGKRVRRGNMDAWQYIYSEHNRTETNAPTKLRDGPPSFDTDEDDENEGLVYARRVVLEPHLRLPSVVPPVPRPELPTACDPEHPRIYHMFWAGPFTDKPHLALLSYLFTQNLGLNVPPGQPVSKDVCRPQFWVWINPGPAASVPNPNAWDDMYSSLKANPWSSPFLHPRFEDVIKIKMWNTTEQLDSIPEIKDDWRNVDELFNSGGHKFGVKVAEPSPAATPSAVTSDTKAPPATLGINVTASTSSPLPSKADRKKVDANDLHGRLGSSSQNDYDRLSVVLSDMVRFVLTHRFGGIYLDADTILLRDWEELWGWKGAFAYRWSRLETYNTAVLHMNKRSALGSFLFRTALRNGLDFHPMTVSRYMKEAYLEGLLLRLPDALFDSAWLNVEWYQRDRPAFPYFTDFHDLFTSAAIDGAGPLMLGFEGFFRGAFSYHFHNFWWEPFDPARNWPDLGHRFIEGERKARYALHARAKAAQGSQGEKGRAFEFERAMREDDVSADAKDLPWATVLKRTFESYVRGERPNMYGEWIEW